MEKAPIMVLFPLWIVVFLFLFAAVHLLWFYAEND